MKVKERSTDLNSNLGTKAINENGHNQKSNRRKIKPNEEHMEGYV